MDLGVTRGEVVLSEYQESWVKEFDKVKEEILSVTSLSPDNIQHIGSTSIQGLMAKPVIDIAIGVDDYEDMDENFYKSLSGIGIYRLRVERDDEIVLAKFKDNQFQVHTHFIHLVDKNGAKWNELIKFRDYLRKNEDAKLEYMTLKKSLSSLYAEDRAKYTDSKEAFVKSIINKR
ncbi:GrpB family protein [Macrococcoides canis]|uniref:Dephospho-CoA kinase/protein folding accessory domain-containing protein n=1 Tax=Macrococcoides canis TaxID=1855823 RepID=A0A1W7A8S0_9STAP|nr:GrpB family protein [Macrococcus canis]ARQ06035.1 dephospho-CoA kinase/protein folding accessory domain-containing protein [Macrococcus canis]UTH00379.1 GrpB family protein [Macrococcus canis]WBF52610.1 GrpB family protein [Macrococcus canis]